MQRIGLVLGTCALLGCNFLDGLNPLDELGTDDGEAMEDCELTVQIDTAVCSFIDDPDMFQTDWWTIEMSGTASGNAVPASTSTQFYVEQDESYSTSETCPEWGDCVLAEGEPESTTWTATITLIAGDEASRTLTVRALADKFGSTYCEQPAIHELDVTCTK